MLTSFTINQIASHFKKIENAQYEASIAIIEKLSLETLEDTHWYRKLTFFKKACPEVPY